MFSENLNDTSKILNLLSDKSVRVPLCETKDTCSDIGVLGFVPVKIES